MKISISGTHSIGKTTLYKGLKPFLGDWTFGIGSTRKARELLGFPINNEADNYNATQMFCLSIDLNNLSIPGNVIMDRCLLDTFIYTQYLWNKDKVSYRVVETILSFWKLENHIYDLIVVPDINDVPLVNDDVRSMDMSFRQEIHNQFEAVLKNSSRVLKVKGTNEERIQQVLNRIAELQS